MTIKLKLSILFLIAALISFGQNDLKPGSIFKCGDEVCVVVKMSDIRKSNEQKIRLIQYVELSDSLKKEVYGRDSLVELYKAGAQLGETKYELQKEVSKNWNILFDTEYKKNEKMGKAIRRQEIILYVVGGFVFLSLLLQTLK